MTKTFDQRAQTIRLLVLDVDGVLTDGSLTFTGEGELSKTFNVRDGLGIKLLQAAGIEVAILTGRTSSIVAHRADELGMTRVEQGKLRKLPTLKKMLTEAKLQPENIAYMGDDLPDIPCLKLAGLAATPSVQNMGYPHPSCAREVGAHYCCRTCRGIKMAHRRMIIRERLTAIIGSAILFALVATSYWYSIQTQVAGLKYVPSEMSPDFLARNVSLTDFTPEGTPKLLAYADDVQHFSDERMRAERIQVISLDPNSAPAFAQADEGWSNDGLETIDLTGHVLVHRRQYQDQPPMTFTTEHLTGWLDTQRFKTDSPVKITRGADETSSQNGLLYDNVTRVLELYGGVESVFHPQSFRKADSAAPAEAVQTVQTTATAESETSAETARRE